MGAPSMATIVTISKIFAAIGTAVKVAASAAAAKMVFDPPKPDLPDMTSLMNANISHSKYQYAPTQDVNVGFQNYMDNLKKVAPYYVSRYKPELNKRFVDTINLREAQAARDQPEIHSNRSTKAKIQLAERQRSIQNAQTEE
jgi:hypothetical protein